jgi:hypothetical protein
MTYCKPKVLLGLAAHTSGSSGSSPSIFVGDCRLLSLSVQTGSNTSASAVTVSLSNNHGLDSADSLLVWSTVTVLPNRGIFTVDPGARWLRAERANFAISGASNCTVILNRYYE